MSTLTEGRLRTTAQAAVEVGRTPETLRRWRRNGWLRPASLDPLTGEYLWSERELDRMRLFVTLARADKISRLRKFWRRSPAA